MQLDKVKFGPFKGYQSSVEAVMAPPDFIIGDTGASQTNSSRDMLLDPGSGFWFRRQGCAIVGDTINGSNAEQAGLLESGMKFSARARRIFKLQSPSTAAGRTVRAVLYGNDTNVAGSNFPSSDGGWFGTVYARNDNGSGENYNLLKDFSSSHYPTNASSFSTSANGLIVCPPLWYESGEGGYTRGAFRFSRQFLAAGSRSVVQAGNWLALGNLRGTPIRWDKTFNNISGSATANMVRVMPLGPNAPIHPGTINAAVAATGNDVVWKDGDTYFYSVVYQFEDGSYSQPFLPRKVSATLGARASYAVGGIGMAVIGTLGAAAGYSSVTWKNIPIGPAGTIARLLVRSPKQNRTASTDAITVSPFDLRVTGILTNNTQTTYTDTVGSDVGLIDNDAVVRLDTVCPRRSRYMWTGDQRVQAGYTLPNTLAIVLGPVSTNSDTDYDLNLADTASLGTVGYVYRVTTIALELYQFTSASPNLGTVFTIDWATYPTVQDVADKINATVVASSCKAWRATLAAGVDPTTASTGLCPTVQATGATCTTAINSATLTSSVTTAFDAIPLGAYISCTNVPAGTYVKTKEGVVGGVCSLTMSANASGNGSNLTATFWAYCGDGDGTDSFFSVAGPVSKPGCLRAFGASYPGTISFKRTALAGYDKPDKQKVYFTVGSPGAASAGSSLAINTWGADNFRLPTISNPGILLGGVDIEGASVVAYQHGIALFKNIRGANTGEDYDYKLFTINASRGPVSWSAIASGNGWAAYGTREGIFCTDKNLKEFDLSGAIYNPARNLGDLVYEINKSVAATDADDDSSYFYMSVLRTKLAVSYRSSASFSSADSVLWYDFSPGIEASGVEELASSDTRQSYGWSSPCRYNAVNGRGLGPLAAIPTDVGMLYYGCHEGNNSATADGRIDQIETGSADNGETQFAGIAMFPHLISDDFTRMSAQRIQFLHKRPIGTTLVTLAVSRDAAFTNSTAYQVSNSTDPFIYQAIQLASNPDRSPTSVIWLRYTDQESSGGNQNGFWTLALQYQTLPL